MTVEEWEEEDAELFTSLHLIYAPLHLRSELPFQNRGEIKRWDERTSGWLYSPSTEKLHPQQGEHHGEEEEEKKKADDGLHGAHERHDQVPERGPVSGKRTPDQHKKTVGGTRRCSLLPPNSLGDLEDSEESQRPQNADPK